MTTEKGDTTLDPHLEAKARQVSEKFSENLFILSNEPSLALYRIQEHVRRSLPAMVSVKHDLNQIQEDVQGGHYDLEQNAKAVQSIITSEGHFKRIQEQLRNALYLKQQLDYETSRHGRTGLPTVDSSDSLIQELRKSKSLGHLKKRDPTRSDSMVSFSTQSTPVSEAAPDTLLTPEEIPGPS